MTAPAAAAWTTPAVDGAAVTPGQDDLAGGWPDRDTATATTIHGDGGDDFVVGDNGSIARVVDGGTTDRVYTQRYGASRTGQAKVRVAGGGAASTRFCPTTGSTATATCEVSGAFGATACSATPARTCSTARTARTPSGAERRRRPLRRARCRLLYGEDGEDAILGDRGGVQDRYEIGPGRRRPR